MQHPGAVSVILFIAALAVGMGGWVNDAHITTWSDLLTVQHFISLLASLGSVTIAWFAKNPQKKTNGGTE